MDKITFKETIRLIKTDLPRYQSSFLKAVFFIPGFKYTFHQRLCYFFSQHKIFFPIFLIHWLYFRHITYLYGVQLSWNTLLGEDFVIAHFGGIVFFPHKVGNHIIIRQNVTVGTSDPDMKGPIIGNNVSFGANSVVIGPIIVGDNVVIGASSVVTKDVPSCSVVAGNPARVIRRLDVCK